VNDAPKFAPPSAAAAFGLPFDRTTGLADAIPR
jgi:hypothetical protein